MNDGKNSSSGKSSPIMKVYLKGKEVDVYDIFSFYTKMNKELKEFETHLTGLKANLREDDIKKIKEYKKELENKSPEYIVDINGNRFHVKYREDMWNYEAKEPNVVFLTDENGKIKYVLREPRIYSPDDYEMRNFRKTCFSGETKNLDVNGYKKLFLGEFNGFDERKYLFIPEPMLLVAMNRIEKKKKINTFLPSIVPIPAMKEGQKGTKNFYYLRKYFTERGNILDVLGITLSLGLRIFPDIESNFNDIYNDGKPFMIDPDFILFGGKENREYLEIISIAKANGKGIRHKDIENKKKEHEKIYKEINLLDHIPKNTNEILKEFANWSNS